jgi:hypothetical protein
MRTCLPVRVESLWWMRGLRRLLRSLGTLPLVLDASSLGLCFRSRRSRRAVRRSYFATLVTIPRTS